MEFTLKINCDNDVFQPIPNIEIARILSEISLLVEYKTHGNILDQNGNIVGKYSLD